MLHHHCWPHTANSCTPQLYLMLTAQKNSSWDTHFHQKESRLTMSEKVSHKPTSKGSNRSNPISSQASKRRLLTATLLFRQVQWYLWPRWSTATQQEQCVPAILGQWPWDLRERPVRLSVMPIWRRTGGTTDEVSHKHGSESDQATDLPSGQREQEYMGLYHRNDLYNSSQDKAKVSCLGGLGPVWTQNNIKCF